MKMHIFEWQELKEKSLEKRNSSRHHKGVYTPYLRLKYIYLTKLDAASENIP